MSLRIIRNTLVLSLAFLGLAAGYFRLTPFSLPGTQATTDVCQNYLETETSVQKKWSGAIYELDIEQSENCGVGLHEASVQRLGGDLFVRTRYQSPSGMYTGCNCGHRTKLSIPGLPRQDYRVHVYSWP